MKYFMITILLAAVITGFVLIGKTVYNIIFLRETVIMKYAIACIASAIVTIVAGIFSAMYWINK